MQIAHNHYCQHCDRIFSCRENPCPLLGKTIALGTARRYATRKTQGKIRSLPLHVSDISHLHDCPEAERFRLAMRNATRDNATGCKYGCYRLPCAHGATIRFPRMGGSVTSRAAETFEKNPASAIGDAIKSHGLYSKPDARRLRDFFDGRTIACGYGIREKSPAGERTDATDPTHAPTDETLANRNLVRTASGSEAIASAISSGATDRPTHDENKCINRKCSYCNARYNEIGR